MMSDLFNGWNEDGEPEGYDSEMEAWNDEYMKRARRYYDRKVARGEETAGLALIFCVVLAVVAWIGLMIWGFVT